MKYLNLHKLKQNIENSVQQDIQAGRVGGAVLVVSQSGKEVYRGVFGKKNEQTPASETDIYRLASMTKPITATAILIQAQRGLLSLDDTIDRYLPAFASMKIGTLEKDGSIKIKGEATQKIRIRHLLTHSSGLVCGEMACQLGKMPQENKKSLETAVDFYATTVLSFEPYSAQIYSGVAAFDVLARIVEITSGQTFDVFLEQEIFQPLGMKDTMFQPSEEQWERMVDFHNFEDGVASFGGGEPGCIFEKIPTAWFCGGAGLASTVDDYSKFANMLLNRGRVGDRQLVESVWMDEMKTPQVTAEMMPDTERWGLGVRVIVDEAYQYLPVGTFGWSGAYGSHFWVDPENEITAIYMKNSHYDGGSGTLTGKNFEKDVAMALEE